MAAHGAPQSVGHVDGDVTNAGAQERLPSDSPVQSAASLELAWRVVYAAEQRKAALIEDSRPLAYRARRSMGREKSPARQLERPSAAHGIRGGPQQPVVVPACTDLIGPGTAVAAAAQLPVEGSSLHLPAEATTLDPDSGAVLSLGSTVGRQRIQADVGESTTTEGRASAPGAIVNEDGISVAWRCMKNDPRQLLVETQRQLKEKARLDAIQHKQQMLLQQQLLIQQQHQQPQQQLNAGPEFGHSAATLHSLSDSEHTANNPQATVSAFDLKAAMLRTPPFAEVAGGGSSAGSAFGLIPARKDCQVRAAPLPASSANGAAEVFPQISSTEEVGDRPLPAALSQTAPVGGIQRASHGTAPITASTRMAKKVSAASAGSSGRGGTVTVAAASAVSASASISAAAPCDTAGPPAGQRASRTDKISSTAIRRSRSVPASEGKRDSVEASGERSSGVSGAAASSTGSRHTVAAGERSSGAPQPRVKRNVTAGGHKGGSSASSSMPKTNGAAAAGAGAVAAKKRAKALKKIMLPFWYAEDDPRVGHVEGGGLEGRILPEFLPPA